MKKIYSKWFKTNKIHILVWSLFLFYEIIVIGLISKRFGNPITYLFHYGINISIFYFHSNILLPWAIRTNTIAIFRIPFILLVEISAYTLVSYFCDVFLIYINVITHINEIELSHQLVLMSAYRCIYFLGFSTGYYFIANYIKERKRAAEAEKQNLIRQYEVETALANTQNAFLKAQINPHFLFNTLDFVYHSIETDTHKASEAIMLLSRMMRYAVSSDEHTDFIFLEDEIEQVENLLYLYQLRKENHLPIQLKCSSEIRRIKFIPLVLLTLVENIIKHGDLSASSQEAIMRIFIKNGKLCIETDNLIGVNSTIEGTHVGLSNIKKRLEYAYGQDIYFEHFTDVNNHFVVKISLLLESLHVHDVPLNGAEGNDIERLHVNVGLKQITG